MSKFKYVPISLFIIWFVAFCFHAVNSTLLTGYRINKNILAWEQRAQVSADADDMALYLDRAVKGLERYHLTEGQCVLLLPTPRTDIGLKYRAIVQMQQRAEMLKAMSEDDVVYQTGLDDLRGTLREYDPAGFDCFMRANYTWYILLMWISFSLFIISGLFVTFASIKDY